MKRSRLFVVGTLLAGFGWTLAAGCSASEDPNLPAGPGNGTGGILAGAGGGGTVIVPNPGSGGSPTPTSLNPLCGSLGIEAGVCQPDNAGDCLTYTPPGMGGAGGEGGASAGGVSGGGAPGAGGAEAGQAGQGGVGQAGDAAAGGGGQGGEGGSGEPVPPGSPKYGCQVSRQNNQTVRQCVPAGVGTTNAPCFSAADCAPSFACVSDGDTGRCLPYCCSATTTCRSGSYCAERPLLSLAGDPTAAAPPHVPVCVPADNCSLEEHYPCATPGACRCQGDTVCMVVRDDGTTTCLKPGSGEQGQACPCAWNHVCSSATQQCVKICNTDPAKDDCGQQKCQASSELPPNFGVCVGPLR